MNFHGWDSCCCSFAVKEAPSLREPCFDRADAAAHEPGRPGEGGHRVCAHRAPRCAGSRSRSKPLQVSRCGKGAVGCKPGQRLSLSSWSSYERSSWPPGNSRLRGTRRHAAVAAGRPAAAGRRRGRPGGRCHLQPGAPRAVDSSLPVLTVWHQHAAHVLQGSLTDEALSDACAGCRWHGTGHWAAVPPKPSAQLVTPMNNQTRHHQRCRESCEHDDVVVVVLDR
jgi:hypothetical protein